MVDHLGNLDNVGKPDNLAKPPGVLTKKDAGGFGLSVDDASLSADDFSAVLELAHQSGFQVRAPKDQRVETTGARADQSEVAPAAVPSETGLQTRGTEDSAQTGGTKLAPLSADPILDGGEPVVFEQPTAAVKDLFGASFSDMEAFAHLLEAEGELRGLIGPREASRLWSRHLVNSAAVLDFLPRRGSVLDIGSGAGFPGIVIAICRPDLDVYLAEPMLRRCEWLADVVDELALDNVRIIQARAEDLRGKLKADAVTARAVANMTKLIRITTRLIAPHGRLIALKGRRASEEVEAAGLELKKHHLKAVVHQVASVMEDESTFVVTCTRN